MRRSLVFSGIGAALVAGVVLWSVSRTPSAAPEEVAVSSSAPVSAVAPAAGGSDSRNLYLHNLELLKPPPGAKVAVYEFDDLECPSCAHALPLVHAAVERYKVPLVHRDFPLTELHVWSFDAAVTARYLQDKMSPSVADEFRRDVFANQTRIASRDDLQQFTGRWFQAHGLVQPFVMDADGSCQREVRADRAFGDRLGVAQHGTPCIFVVTPAGAAVVDDVGQLDRLIQTALDTTAKNEGDVRGSQATGVAGV